MEEINLSEDFAESRGLEVPEDCLTSSSAEGADLTTGTSISADGEDSAAHAGLKVII